jgi:hypothetical protein
MLPRWREVDRARHQIDRHPGVNLEARATRERQGLSEGIESGMSRKLRRTRLERARVVRVATSPDLHDERVEATVLRRLHHLHDGLRRGERPARHPERANFRARRLQRRNARSTRERGGNERTAQAHRKRHRDGGVARAHQKRNNLT